MKSTAATGQVWEYVDLSKEQVSALNKLSVPEPKNIKPGMTNILGLFNAERLELREQQKLYKFTLTRYNRCKNALAELQRYI